MSDTAVHLGHTITSNDRDNITKSAKSSFWKSFNILIAEFGKLSPFVISKLFNQYCCSFYGSPLWSISGAAVQALCVDWRKALRSMWRLNPRTHCDLITALSSQIPLIVSLKKDLQSLLIDAFLVIILHYNLFLVLLLITHFLVLILIIDLFLVSS